MHSVGSGFQGRNRIDHAQSTILMTVPVDFHFGVDSRNDPSDKADQVSYSPRSGVPHCIGDAHSNSTSADRSAVEFLNVLGFRTSRVLGHKHQRNLVLDGKLNYTRALSNFFVDIPPFREESDRRRPDEEVGFDGCPNAYRDLLDQFDILLPH